MIQPQATIYLSQLESILEVNRLQSPACLTSMYREFHRVERRGDQPLSICVDWEVPAYVLGTLTHACHPAPIVFSYAEGDVGIGCQNPFGWGKGPISWTVSVSEPGQFRRYARVTARTYETETFKPADLDRIVPPKLGLSDVVSLDGNLPEWALVSIAMAYHGQVAAVALEETVAITHVADIPLGTTVS